MKFCKVERKEKEVEKKGGKEKIDPRDAAACTAYFLFFFALSLRTAESDSFSPVSCCSLGVTVDLPPPRA